MNQKDFTDAFIFLFSGVATMKNERELYWEDEYRNSITIEFPTNTPTHAIVRHYWGNGNKRWETEYHNGILHGRHLGWYEDGSKRWEMGIEGQKNLVWDMDGKLIDTER